LTVDTILIQDSEPICATVQENIVLLSIRAGAYFRFNRVGAEIWNMLIEPRRVGGIFDVLAQTHDVDVDTMTRDVAEFLDALIKRRMAPTDLDSRWQMASALCCADADDAGGSVRPPALSNVQWYDDHRGSAARQSRGLPCADRGGDAGCNGLAGCTDCADGLGKIRR
jgi:Coenzyme PQQ synthesis protein D (PqqD)